MTQSLASVSVIIPAIDEEHSLPLVLGDLPAVGEVIVVDNGSKDRTAELARSAGARVIAEPRRGYGSACLAGIAALSKSCDLVVFLDGDYSDHPEELVDVIAAIVDDRADMVIGSRMNSKCQPGALLPQAALGNRLAVFLIQLLFGQSYTDLGPFRAIRRDSLTDLDMADTNFGWTVEMQIKAVQKRLRILEVPVSYRRRVGRSKITGTLGGTIKAGYKILYTIFRYGIPRG